MANPPGKVRIIGGQWRGRSLPVLTTTSIRPTPNRIRETLFNWLAPTIRGARCLDVFAGSGALGFEALSRGAVYAAMLDSSPKTITQLQNNIHAFQATQYAIALHATIPNYIPHFQQPFDIVFLDPPFHQNMLPIALAWLETHHLLAPNALIYLEAEKQFSLTDLPTHWQLLKEKQAGEVKYGLVKID